MIMIMRLGSLLATHSHSYTDTHETWLAPRQLHTMYHNALYLHFYVYKVSDTIT